MGWVTPAFLAAGVTILIPIIIHLLPNRRHPPEVIGTLRFLRQALREGYRKRRLKDILLLLARIAVVALLALLFARPYLREDRPAGGRDTAILVLVDASGSMGGETLGASNSSLARQEAAAAADDVPEGSDITIAAFGTDVTTVEDPAVYEPPSGAGTDYAAAIKWARDHLTLSDRPHKRVVIITDLQATGLPEEALPTWPLDVAVDVVSLQPPAPWNGAITSVRPAQRIVGPESFVEIAVAVHGETPGGEVPLTVTFEGNDPLIATVPLRTGLVRLKWTPTEPGIYRGVVELETEDSYPVDNRRPFAFVLREPTCVVLVDGSPGRTPYQQETYFLEVALGVAERDKRVSPFVPVRREALGAVAGTHVVALCNVARLTSKEADELANHVTSGGGLIYFLGDTVDIAAYRELAASGLFPATLERYEADSSAPIGRSLMASRLLGGEPMLQWDSGHPALALFAEREGGDLSRIRFRRAFRLTPKPQARVLAHLQSGEPAIVEGRLGEGRIIAVANPCDRDWGDWPQERVFLPLMRELFHYLAGRPGSETAGERGSGDDHILEQTPTLKDGRSPGLHGTDPLVVIAADPGEADPRPCDEATFRARLGLPQAEPDEPEPIPEKARPPKSKRERELWIYLAAALLIGLYIENLLADRG